MKKFLVVFSLFLLSLSLYANEKQEIKDKFLKRIDEVVKVVENKTLTKDKRDQKIVEILTPSFDFELMAKLSLGKVWKKLDKTNQKKFVELYVDRMKRSYSSKLDGYSGEKVKITDIKQPKPNRIELVTNIVNKNEKLEISYKYYKAKSKPNKDSWLIYDAVVLGVSILKTDRAQFAEFLQTKSIEDLMEQLVKK